MVLHGKSILLIIGGGIAAYKSLELTRLLRKGGAQVRCVLTAGGAQFITPLSAASLSEQPCYTDLWSLKDETEMGHIRLSREADLIVIAPASADLLAKMAAGMANDLATTVLLASDKPALAAPAMNHRMWDHPATQANLRTLQNRGLLTVGPNEGDMACGEFGVGRMAEPTEILAAIEAHFATTQNLAQDLKGRRALVTSGPTQEPIDPVRYLGNRSSGKQGHAIAAALRARGAEVTLVTGPVALADPAGVQTVHVQTGREMLAACEAALPADFAIYAAAVADWHVADVAAAKLKKQDTAPSLALIENPDVLGTLSRAGPRRPRLVVGFAAETGNLAELATAKRVRKNCDWLIANDVSGGAIFGADDTRVLLIDDAGQSEWQGSKRDIAERLAARIAAHFKRKDAA